MNNNFNVVRAWVYRVGLFHGSHHHIIISITTHVGLPFTVNKYGGCNYQVDEAWLHSHTHIWVEGGKEEDEEEEDAAPPPPPPPPPTVPPPPSGPATRSKTAAAALPKNVVDALNAAKTDDPEAVSQAWRLLTDPDPNLDVGSLLKGAVWLRLAGFV